jgi:tetratricopeptide (TPR) repeat protein
VSRRFLILALSAVVLGAQKPAPVEQEPPEEDVNPNEVKEYVLNPLQAEKEMKVGAFYFKKGSYRAALRRFEEATKWNPDAADAWLRLGDTHAKLGDAKEARTAWTKFLELQPDGKNSDEIRKRLNRSRK